jgi:hypothetical protein
MAAAGDRQLELGADAVRRRDEDGIGEAGSLQIEQGGEAAEAGGDARSAGRSGERSDRVDQPSAGVDVDARILVGEWANASPRKGVLE